MQVEALGDFLLSDRAPGSRMQLCDFEAILTGIAVGPELISPSEWFTRIWGEDGKPEFADDNEVTRVVSPLHAAFLT